MELFLKATAMVLITVILTLFLARWEKDTAIILSIAACCIVGTAAFHYLEPVLSLLEEMKDLVKLPGQMFSILLKAVGITLLCEISCSVCSDSGNGSLAKMLHLIGYAAVFYLSIPVFHTLLDILTDIIGEL